MKEFQFADIYSLISLIDQSVNNEVNFWNFDEDYFIAASTGFSKDTLLHQYIVTCSFNHYHRYFRKNSDIIDEGTLEYWRSLFSSYKLSVPSLNVGDEEACQWINNNEDNFINLFNHMSDEVFHILFSNRNFLLKFNKLVSETVKQIDYPYEFLTKKGTIRRKAIPKWLQNSIYHRDKGRCVFCNTDLTGMVNILTSKNFDHIVPLDFYGTNDPCNMQLACERCNKRKSNREASTSFKYQPWWSN
jgi:hypothetical protein